MKKENLVRFTVGIFLVTLSSFALDLNQLSAIQQSAQELERSATYLQNSLKSKKPNVEIVIANFETMSSHLSNLDLIAHRFEASKPNLDESTKLTWTLIRQRIQALSLSHGTSDRLAGQELQNYRLLIRAYAGHIAQQARIVQTSAATIQRSSPF